MPPIGTQMKPPVGAQIDWESMAADGLVFFAMPGGGHLRDLVGGNFATFFGAASGNGVTQIGPAMNNPGTASDGCWWVPSQNLYSIGNRITLICWARPETLGAWSTLISVPYANGSWVSPFAAVALQRNSTLSSAQFGYTTSTTNRSCTSATGYIQVEGLTCYAVTRDAAAVVFYRNGAVFSTTTTASSDTGSINWTNRQGVTIGNHSYSSVGEGLQGKFLLAEIWSQPLTPSQMMQRFLDPWGVLKRGPDIMFAGGAAAAARIWQLCPTGYTPTIAGNIWEIGTI